MCAYINLFNNSPQKILLHNTVLIHSFALSLALFFFFEEEYHRKLSCKQKFTSQNRILKIKLIILPPLLAYSPQFPLTHTQLD